MGSCLEGQLSHNVLQVSLSALPQNINRPLKHAKKQFRILEIDQILRI